MADSDKTSIDRPEVGGWETITVVPVFEDGSSQHPAGSNGKYKVEFILGVSTYQIDNINCYS